MSAPARVLFRGLLAYLDDEGVLYLPKSKHAHNALGMALGYSKDERRALKRQLTELTDHGCLSVTQDEAGFWTLEATGWRKYQAPKKGEASAPMEAPPSVKSERSENTMGADRVHTGCTTGANRVQTDRPNRAKSLGPDLQEKRREEEREGARASEPPKGPTFRDPLGELGDVSSGRLTTRFWALAMRELSPQPWDESLLSGRDRERLAEITTWARTTADVAQRQGGDWKRTYIEALRGSLVAFRDEYRKRPGSVPLSPGGWWARRESWRSAA